MKQQTLLLLVVLVMTSTSDAENGGVTMPWSTSFMGGPSDKDTNYPVGGWAIGTNNTVYNNVNAGPSLSPPTGNQVVRAANYPGGAGGRGWRRWVSGGSAYKSTGSISVQLKDEPEIWARWYMRWEAGFEWNKEGILFAKLVYIRPIGGGVIMGLLGPDGVSIMPARGGGTGKRGPNHHVYAKDGTPADTTPGCGWNTMNPDGAKQPNGYNLGDDSWHAIEFHFKNQSGPGTFDGVWDLWIDGVLKSHVTGINWDKDYCPGVRSLQFMINQGTPTNPRPMYNDIDDMAISKTGPVGLIGQSKVEQKKGKP